MSILSAGFRLGGRGLGFGLLGTAPCCNKWVMFDELGRILGMAVPQNDVQIALAVPRRSLRSSRSWSSLVIISFVILSSGCSQGRCSLGCCGPFHGCFGPWHVFGPVLSCCGFLGWCGPVLVWRGLVVAGSQGPVMAVVLGCCGPGCCGPGFSLVVPVAVVLVGSSGPGTCGPGCSGLESGFQQN